MRCTFRGCKRREAQGVATLRTECHEAPDRYRTIHYCAVHRKALLEYVAQVAVPVNESGMEH